MGHDLSMGSMCEGATHLGNILNKRRVIFECKLWVKHTDILKHQFIIYVIIFCLKTTHVIDGLR